MRIQPDEAIYLKINNKIPGLGMKLDVTKLDLTYKQRYNQHLPDAYERLILDVVNGDKRLFIRNDELDAAWALFTPILKVRLDRNGPRDPVMARWGPPYMLACQNAQILSLRMFPMHSCVS